MLPKQAKDGNYGQEGSGITRTTAAALRIVFRSSYGSGGDNVVGGKNMNNS